MAGVCLSLSYLESRPPPTRDDTNSCFINVFPARKRGATNYPPPSTSNYLSCAKTCLPIGGCPSCPLNINVLPHCTAAPAPQNMTAGDDCTLLESAKQKRARLRGETQKDIADVKKIDALEESDHLNKRGVRYSL